MANWISPAALALLISRLLNFDIPILPQIQVLERDNLTVFMIFQKIYV